MTDSNYVMYLIYQAVVIIINLLILTRNMQL